MQPTFHHELATARVADLHHHAARKRTAKAAIQGRRAQPHRRTRSVPGHAATVLATTRLITHGFLARAMSFLPTPAGRSVPRRNK